MIAPPSEILYLTFCWSMSEKLSVKWNDFKENASASFHHLREDNEFADVTLACEDGQQIEAHKVILAASSPFFQNLLKRNKHTHPLIYMRGIKWEVLTAVVDFVYLGETNVSEQNLDPFLALAEELNLKGLVEQTDDLLKEDNEVTKRPIKTKTVLLKREQLKSDSESLVEVNRESGEIVSSFISAESHKLDEQVKSMMEKSENNIPDGKSFRKSYICKVCGKEGHCTAIRDHIEANHLEGVSLPCNICGNIFRSRSQLRKHKCKIT